MNNNITKVKVTPTTPKVTATAVRRWAIENPVTDERGNTIAVGMTRGRIPIPVIRAYNKANPKAKYEGPQGRAAKIMVKQDGRPPRTLTVPVADVRRLAAERGLAKADARGRLSRKAWAAAAESLVSA